jgi:hypothetical protein
MGTNAPDASDIAAVMESEVDSNRFGLRVGRFFISPESILRDHEVVSTVMSSGFDLVILRYPSVRRRLGAMISENSRSSFQADTLLYFSRSINRMAIDVRPGGTGIRFAHLNDDAAIRNIALKAFGSYGSHYAANPRIETSNILDGYVDWSSRQLIDATAVLVHESTKVDGFLTLKIDDGIAEIVLNAVDPMVQNQGIYQSLLESAVCFASENDCHKIVTSTQSTNFGVMRAWVKNGFNAYLSLNTVHVNLTGN